MYHYLVYKYVTIHWNIDTSLTYHIRFNLLGTVIKIVLLAISKKPMLLKIDSVHFFLRPTVIAYYHIYDGHSTRLLSTAVLQFNGWNGWSNPVKNTLRYVPFHSVKPLQTPRTSPMSGRCQWLECSTCTEYEIYTQSTRNAVTYYTANLHKLLYTAGQYLLTSLYCEDCHGTKQLIMKIMTDYL